MRIALLILLLCAPLGVAAQSADDGIIRRVLTPALPDTVTTDALGEVDGRATGAPYTGVVRDLWPDGRLKLLRSVENGRPAGLWTEWYETGVVRYLAEWHPEGLGEGVWFYFHESGLVRDRTVYRRDRAWGPTEGWHANGRKAYDGHYRDNARVGRWRWWNAGGGLDSTRTHDDGTTGWRPASDDGAVRPFAPDVVSTPGAEEFGLALAPDGRSAFFTRRRAGEPQSIYVSTYARGAWSEPERAPFSTDVDESPHMSADGARLLFASRRPGGTSDPGDPSDNLWVVERQGGGWAEPRPLAGLNRPRPAGAGWPVASELHPALGPDGALYYWTQEPGGSPDLYRAPPVGDGFGRAVPLPHPVNTEAAEASPAVAPDGGLVFQAYGRGGGAGGEDLFVTWPRGAGWTEPVPLALNTAADEMLPSFSPDGSTLFFSSDRVAPGDYDLYSVSWAAAASPRP